MAPSQTQYGNLAIHMIQRFVIQGFSKIFRNRKQSGVKSNPVLVTEVVGPPVLELLAGVVGGGAEVLELLARVVRDGADVPRGACVGVAPRPAVGGTGVTCEEETCSHEMLSF